MTGSELRPILGQTFSLYRNKFWLFIGIMAPAALVGKATTILDTLLGIVTFLRPINVVLPAYAMAYAGTVFAVSEVLAGRSPSIPQCYRRVCGKVLPVIVALVLVTLAIAAVTTTRSAADVAARLSAWTLGICIIIWIVLRCAMLIPAATMENLKGLTAIRRSGELSKGIMGLIFLFFSAFLSLSFIDDFVFLWLGVPSMLGDFATSALVGPLIWIALTLVYFDQRVRKEAARTPLHRAAFYGYKEEAEQLLAKGANVNAKDDKGRTPLDVAKTEEMKALLRKYGAKK